MPQLAIKNPRLLSYCRAEKKLNYCVIYTASNAIMDMARILKKHLPGERGTVFCPRIEVWRRGKEKGYATVPLFPGYLFIKSDLTVYELHKMVMKRKYELTTYARELGLKSRYSDETALGEEIMVNDLSEEEAAFMDFVMEIDAIQNPDNYEEGLLRMSYGYKETLRDSNGNQLPHIHVVSGPLKGLENHIVKVNQHDRKAYLDIKINGKAIRVGLEIVPERRYQLDKTKVSVALVDGFELNPGSLANKMMGAGEDTDTEE